MSAAGQRKDGPRFTQADLLILRLMADQRTPEEIAVALSLTPVQVGERIARILRELDVTTVPGAVAKSIMQGFIGPLSSR